MMLLNWVTKYAAPMLINTPRMVLQRPTFT